MPIRSASRAHVSSSPTLTPITRPRSSDTTTGPKSITDEHVDAADYGASRFLLLPVSRKVERQHQRQRELAVLGETALTDVPPTSLRS
jgi:hypothetical protein